MRPVILSLSTAGLSLPCPLDYKLTPQQVMLSYKQNGASAQATVQWSPDDPFGTYDNVNGGIKPWPVDYNTNGTWYDISALSAMVSDAQYTLGGTGSDNDFPARGIRLKNNSYTSGTNQLTITQAGDHS